MKMRAYFFHKTGSSGRFLVGFDGFDKAVLFYFQVVNVVNPCKPMKPDHKKQFHWKWVVKKHP